MPQQVVTLAAQIVSLLQTQGVPEGMWLLEIARARATLRQVDELLWRMEQAIAAQAQAAPPLSPAEQPVDP